MKSENGNLKKIKKLKSVSNVMWGYFCLLAFFMILLVEIVFYIIVYNTFENEAKQRITSIGQEMEQVVNRPGLDISLIHYRRDGANVYVLTEDLQVIKPEDDSGTAEILNELKRRPIADEGVGYSEVFRAGSSLNYASKVIYMGRPHYILVSYPLTIVRETVSTLQIYLFIVCITVFLTAFLISYGLSKKMTGGLKTISDTAVNLAKGDFNVEFTNADYKELAQLSDSLNFVRDEVKKSEDFQREILANVSHDLKTPLTMIKAYASMIKEISGDNKEKREKHLQVIIDEADRLTGLVNDVLSVSKLQSNMTELKMKVFNLTELVYGIINKFGYLQETQGYNFMVDIDANMYTRADAEKISQVIYNLLGNASNYTGADKTVYISLKSSLDGKRVKFSVRDTGKGIDKEELPDIWNRYYRVKETHNRPVKGTGLGLNIVKAILENHSFDFGVDSEKGKGSVFWVDFPSVPAEV